LNFVYDLSKLSRQKNASKSALDILKAVHGNDIRYLKSTLVAIIRLTATQMKRIDIQEEKV
jgi:hypothetical protein